MNIHSIDIAIAVGALAGIMGIPGAPRASAQTPADDAAQPTFEVASVKPNKSADPGGSFSGRPGGQLVVRNNTLGNMILNAYGLQNFQLVDGPDWIDSDRFDIIAKAATMRRGRG